MRRFIAIVASALGLSAATAVEVKQIDPKSLFYTLATINDALPAVDAGTPSDRDLVLHEDDWRQFEAVSTACDTAMKEELESIRRIFKEKSKKSGEFRLFSEIHVRKRISRPLPTPIVWSELLSASGVELSSVARVGLRDGQGVVRGGFSFQVGRLKVFGIKQVNEVQILCFDFTQTPSLSPEQAERLASFLTKQRVVFVHWPSATVLGDKKSLLTFLEQNREK